MDALSSCSNKDLKRLAIKHGVDIVGMTEKHELVNALKKAVQGAVLLQEAGGQHTGADGGGAGMPARTILSGPSSCSIEQLVHLASERRVEHEVVNVLQEAAAVPEALLLQEAAPSRPLAASSRPLAAPMGGGAGTPANMSLMPVQASQRVSDMDMQLLPRQATGGAATVRCEFGSRASCATMTSKRKQD